MSLEEFKMEHEFTLEDPTLALLNIYEAKNKGGVNELRKALNVAENKLDILENQTGKEKIQDNQNWLVNNNNRINLYQISAILKDEKYNLVDEKMDKIRAEQFFAYRQIQASLVTAGEIQQPRSVSLLVDFIKRKSITIVKIAICFNFIRPINRRFKGYSGISVAIAATTAIIEAEAPSA